MWQNQIKLKMNSSYYQNQINKLEKDIADLQKKIADENKKENGKLQQINSVNKSINKNTTLSSLQSKQRQIEGYQKDIYNIKKKIADYQKQIASKSVDLGKKRQEFRKFEENGQKKFQKEQLEFHRKLEQDIQNQKNKLEFLVSQNYSSKTKIKNKENESKEFDFFISHASEDKDDIVRDLAEALKDNGFEVWYDEFELKIGDSLRKKIDNGLSKSRFGIVIISPFFVKKTGQNTN